MPDESTGDPDIPWSRPTGGRGDLCRGDQTDGWKNSRILGVCLGHQIIGHVFGARVEKGGRPMHGKVTEITHNGGGVFSGLPDTYEVTRYHSLVVREQAFPEELQVDARSEDGVIMGMSHKTWPVYGVQFHPG